MNATNPAPISGTIAITVQPQDNGQYLCHWSSSRSEGDSHGSSCYGQTPDHAIAMALESLAADYRQKIEEQQNLDSEPVEDYPESEEAIRKRYHVILHYEHIVEAESPFVAVAYCTLMGNLVVENATVTVVEVDPDLPPGPSVDSRY